MQKRTNFIAVIFIVLILLNLLAWSAVFELKDAGKLKVVFFAVGQGDAAFIETPGQNQILIDGGPNARVLEKLGEEMPFWDRTIDLIILTHPEQDHIAGLLEVLKRYKVENILWTAVVRDTAEYKEWQNLLKTEGARVFIAEAGETGLKMVKSEKPWNLAILSPRENLSGKIMRDSNDTSVAARLVFGQTSFLFTGDLKKRGELELVNSGANIDSDVLKVAHHGSKTSTVPEFISAVSPEFAVISAGKDNRYGHPHPQTLETLQQYGAKILRTDLDGDVTFVSDGLAIVVQ